MRYKHALVNLGEAFPTLEICPGGISVAEQVAGVVPNEHNSLPCWCGEGCVARLPWVLACGDLGFCSCEAAQLRQIRERTRVIDAGSPGLAW